MNPTLQPEKTPEELYHQSLEALPLILRVLGRKKRLSPEELEDLRCEILIRLLDNDYQVLRRWDKRSSLETYLGTVASNLWNDRVRAEQGRVRVSAAAKRLGPPAPDLEMLLGRQELLFDEAFEMIKPRFPDLSRDEALAIVAQIKPSTGWHFESDDGVDQLPALDPTGAEHLEQREKLVEKRKALDLLQRILSELPQPDRLLLVRAHAEGVKFSRIARSLGIDQKSLYRRNERLLKKLRTELEEAGIRWEDLSEILGVDAPPPEALHRERRGLFRIDGRPARERLADLERHAARVKANVLQGRNIQRIISELPEQDQILLKRAHTEGGVFSHTPRNLGKSLDRRYDKLIEKLKADLEKAGIAWHYMGIAPRPAETSAGERAGGEAALAQRRQLEAKLARVGEFKKIPGEPGTLGTMAETATCVTPNDLAAFLEGSLTGEERDRMIRHLNLCLVCFERYIKAARLLDAIEEEETAALSAADGNRVVDPPPLPPGEKLP